MCRISNISKESDIYPSAHIQHKEFRTYDIQNEKPMKSFGFEYSTNDQTNRNRGEITKSTISIMSDVINKIKEYRASRSPYRTISNEQKINLQPVKPNPIIYQTFEERIKMVSDPDPFSALEDAVKKVTEKSRSNRYRYEAEDRQSQQFSGEFNEIEDYEQLFVITPRYISDCNLNDDENINDELDALQGNNFNNREDENSDKEDPNIQKYDDYIQKLSTIKETESIESKQLEETVNFCFSQKDPLITTNQNLKEENFNKKNKVLPYYLADDSESEINYKSKDFNNENMISKNIIDNNDELMKLFAAEKMRLSIKLVTNRMKHAAF